MRIKARLVVDNCRLTYESVEWNDLARGVRINFRDALHLVLSQLRTVDELSTQSSLLLTPDKLAQWGVSADAGLVEQELELTFVSKELGWVEGLGGQLAVNYDNLQSGDFGVVQFGTLERTTQSMMMGFVSEHDEVLEYAELKSIGNLPGLHQIGEKFKVREFESGYIGGKVLFRIDRRTRLRLSKLPIPRIFSLVGMQMTREASRGAD